MRTNIDIDDALMAKAMQAGPYKTKKDAVEAGLKLLARQAAYREIVKWRGKLRWEGDESIDWTRPVEDERSIGMPLTVGEPPLPAYRASSAPAAAVPTAPPRGATQGSARKKASRARR